MQSPFGPAPRIPLGFGIAEINLGGEMARSFDLVASGGIIVLDILISVGRPLTIST